MNIVITGHIDHGKSTFIGRLLYDTKSIPQSLVDEIEAVSREKGGNIEFAYFLDSLEEERAQNITIDTTQTFFKTAARKYTIIDAPGHKEFLKNMVSGASIADAAILIIDAERGIEEQTRRHASILKLLGLERVIVAINKMDTVSFRKERFEELHGAISTFLSKVGIKPHAIIPISAKMGENIMTPSSKMPWYQGEALLTVLDNLPEPASLAARALRFPVQDVYKHADKSIIVGRLESGMIKAGDEISLMPAGETATVRTVEIWNSKATSAQAGQSIGITLSKPLTVKRGDVITSGSRPRTTDSLSTIIFAMSSARVPAREKLTLQCATQAIPCHVEKISKRMNSSTLEVLDQDSEALEETEVGEVILHTERPLLFEDFQTIPGLGRFVLTRDNGEICGAGIIRG